MATVIHVIISTAVWAYPAAMFISAIRRDQLIQAAVWFCLALKVLWVGMAVYLSSIYKYRHDLEYGINIDEITRVLLIEGVFCAILYGILTVWMPRQIVARKPLVTSGAETLFCLLVIGAMFYVAQSYVGSISEIGARTDEVSLEGRQVGAVHTIMFGVGLLVCASMAVRGDVLPWARLLGLGILCMIGYWRVALGLRGSLVLMALILSFAAVFSIGRIRHLSWVAFLAVLTLPFFTFLGSGVRELNRAMGSAVGARERREVIIASAKGENFFSLESLSASIDALAYRSQDVRNSAVLLREADAGRRAGIVPLVGSALALFPRALWSSKPFMCSKDETHLGDARHLVMAELYGEPTTYGPLLSSAHSYWEFGWIGVFVLPAMTAGIIVVICSKTISAPSVAAQVPLLMLFGISEYYPQVDRPICFYLRDFMLSYVPLCAIMFVFSRLQLRRTAVGLILRKCRGMPRRNENRASYPMAKSSDMSRRRIT